MDGEREGDKEDDGGGVDNSRAGEAEVESEGAENK